MILFTKKKVLNMFLVFINMSTFHFNPSKKFLQLLTLQKNFIITFSPFFNKLVVHSLK